MSFLTHRFPSLHCLLFSFFPAFADGYVRELESTQVKLQSQEVHTIDCVALAEAHVEFIAQMHDKLTNSGKALEAISQVSECEEIA